LALAAVPAAAAPPTLTLKATPAIVTYGGSTALSGTLLPAKANQKVGISSQDCGQGAFKTQANVKTTATGGFTAAQSPTMNENYQAKSGRTTSPTVSVKVAPLVDLKVTGGALFRKFNATVTAAQTFNGKYVVFQRRNARKHKWVTIKKVTLTTQTNGKPPTIITSGAFTVRIIGHPLARLILPAAQAGTCYLSAKSKAVKS
jgi:hypothetical protein